MYEKLIVRIPITFTLIIEDNDFRRPPGGCYVRVLTNTTLT